MRTVPVVQAGKGDLPGANRRRHRSQGSASSARVVMRNQSGMCRGATEHGWPRALCLLTVALLLGAIPACSRSFYRNATDREVNDILTEKDHYPAWWKIRQWHVYPDPRARFA